MWGVSPRRNVQDWSPHSCEIAEYIGFDQAILSPGHAPEESRPILVPVGDLGS